MPKIKKNGKKKSSNVIPIKRDIVEAENATQILSIEEQERERTNKFARKICDEIDEFVKACHKLSNVVGVQACGGLVKKEESASAIR